MAIGFYFTYGGKTIQLPVNPEKLVIKRAGSNQRAEIIDIGEINILRTVKLASISLEFLLPGDDYYPFITGSWQSPDKILKFFKAAPNNNKTVRLAISELNVNMRMSIESLLETWEAGDHESCMCNLELLEYRAYAAKVLKIAPVTAAVTSTTTDRPADKAAPKTYTVKSGDSFWRIADQQLGNGSRYAELAQYNGMSINTVIHPGDVLKLPT